MSTMRRAGRAAALTAAAAISALALASCAPGSAPVASAPAGDVSTAIPTDDLTIRIQDETGFPVTDELTAEFTKQHPNVKFDITRDSFQNLLANTPRLLASDDAPDLIRLSTLGTTVKDGLLTNLDPYFDAYGWDRFPAGQLAGARMDDQGVRGEGSLWQFGIGYSVTGIYMNQELADQVGITEMPATMDELEADLAKAKDAGVLPIQTGMQDGVGTFILQSLINQQGDKQDLVDWMYNKPGATIQTDAALAGATKFQDWAKAGYLPPDVNAINYTTMVSNFSAGQGLFMWDGNWDAANVEKALGQGGAQFGLVPPVEAGGKHVAMGTGNTFAIPAKSKNADVVAAFLNWIVTDEKARQIVVDVTGASPGGDPAQALPTAQEGSLIAKALELSAEVGDDDGFVDFMANSTAGIYQGSLQPNEQLLLTDKMTPADFLKATQDFYEQDLAAQ
ncbi:extracellular solute-binding protein [Clavibacter michiganensis subsp. michiganensis]|uniref:ABC transporter substrate-binding protein n=1 Tax=Clavibacter michiganensis TaxID=28447 RepID=UPI001FF4BE4E|nr:extracellular solute-binding protein [Clavibacter michiganensis]UOW03503.1 extracellular solute-binding protein [Clavibacter michiganensis subsp. michiganensis]